jgi:hypothetical protein
MMRGVLAALVLLAGCVNGPAFLRPKPKAEPTVSQTEILYLGAVAHLDPANPRGSLDSAITYLESYLATPTPIHRGEAAALLRLARDSQRLIRVEAALHLSRAAAPDTKSGETKAARPEGEPKVHEDAAKEIERLKEELAKANAELERIRKRLAAPRPPG